MKKREEIEDKYKANLETIYKDSKEIEEDKKEANSLLEEIKKYKGKVLLNADNLLKVLKLTEKLSSKIEKIMVYYFFIYDLDMTNNSYKKNLDEFENYRIPILQEFAFVNIEIKKINNKLWNKFKNDNKDLIEYDYYIKEIIRLKKYNMSDSFYKFVTKLYPILGSNEDSYSILTNADFTAEDVVVSGKKEKLTPSSYYKFMVNSDRDVRKNANINMLEFFNIHKHTISNLYKNIIKENNTFAKLNKFKNYFEAELKTSNIDTNIYLNLLNFVKSSKPFINKYITLVKKDLGLDEIYGYDLLYNKHESKEYSYEEALKMAEEALSVLGEEYINKFKKGIEERWIDVFPSEGKNVNQYSVNSVETPPLIHLNFNNTFDDINTIVHEMGHSIHMVFSKENVPVIYSEASILITEIVAIVNEMLLSMYVLNKSKDKEEKLFIVKSILSTIKSTIFSQALLADYEYTCTIKDSNDETLTTEDLSDIYMDIASKYEGDEVKSLENSKYQWMRIPHIFESPFYVYKYSLGLFVASGIAYRILEGDKEFKNKYLEFLKKGSSKSDVELLLDLGFDITKENYMENAMKLFNEYLNIYEELLK